MGLPLATAAATNVVNLMTAPAGTDFALNAIALGTGNVPPISLASVLVGNAPPELYEKNIALKYPTVNVYCEKASNKLVEKFRVFSGTLAVVIEIRHSQDQLQGIQQKLENYVGAACQILDSSRGDLGGGIFYAGGYEISYGPVKRGGVSLLQVGRIAIELDVSV